jgi:hypothetical protein
MAVLGAICFGLVIGWITYRTLRRAAGAVGLTGLATVLAAVGGGAVTALFGQPDVFRAYAVGLAIGFFGYLVVATLMPGSTWLDGTGKP